MNKLQRILSIVLSFILVLSLVPAVAEDAETPADVEFPEELIVGHPTITNGDFFTELFGNNTADIDVRALIHGYNLVNWDQNQGTYVFDPSVVRKVEPGIDNEGNHIYLMELADNLYYSNGDHITAWDYAFSLLLMNSPEMEEIGGKIYRSEYLLGCDDYIKSRRQIMAGEELTQVDYISGIRVLTDYQLEITLDADFMPYFFETGLLLTVPYPIKVIAPGCKVTHGYVDDEGNMLGVKIVNEDESQPMLFTPELLKKTILDPETGYNTHPSVVSGPYVITAWDGMTGHFEINPWFKGAWMQNNLPGEDGAGPVANQALERAKKIEGKVVTELDATGAEVLYRGEPVALVKPTIEKIAFTVASNDTMIEELEAGNLHLVNKVTYGETIQKGRSAGDVQFQNYPRIGLAFLTFNFEKPAMKDMGVRQAIAWCMNRQELTAKYCGGNGMVMNGYYGFEQWEYQIVSGRIAAPVNFLEVPEGSEVTELEMADYDRKKRLTNMYYENDEELEVLEKLWEQLRKRWDDGEGHTLLTNYEVNLDNANALLDKYGWTMNREGMPYVAGVDDVRCKYIDGNLEALDLRIMYPQGNHMIEFMQEEGMFVDNLAQAGIKVSFVPEPMEELLRYYYREKERDVDMIYLATNFHVIVDPSITYSTDPTPGHLIWNNTYSDDETLYQLAVTMRKTEPGSYYEYVDRWMSFQERYNIVLPTIPVYSNIYWDFYTPLLQNYNIVNNVTWSQAILASYFGLAEDEEPDLGFEESDDEGFFDD